MKKFLALTIITLVGIASMPTSFAYYPEAQYWEISSFHSDVNINKDGSVNVTETIDADFTNEAHRGIERAIPIKYENGYQSQIKFISATDENGIAWINNVFTSGNYLKIQMTSHDDLPFAHPATYIINYSANNVISFFDDHTEFYWNVTGDEWSIPILNSSISISIPEDIPQDQLDFNCFTGAYGITAKLCNWEVVNGQINFTSTTTLQRNEGFTIALSMPNGYIDEPTTAEIIQNYFHRFMGLLLIPITLILMILIWFKKGRDEKTKLNTIMPHYQAPENLKPTEVGTIIDERMHTRDITASIIDFAVRGYIKIKEIKKEKFLIFDSTDYELEIINRPLVLKRYERSIFEGIFGTTKTKIKISELQNKFYKKIPAIKKEIYKNLVEQNYFPHNPNTIRTIYLVIGGVLLFGGIQLAAINRIDFTIGIIVSGAIVMAFSYFMPRKTKKGSEVYYQLKGLYEYINTAEKDRLKFQEEASVMFEKLLPYAMAFGIAKKWAKAFEGLLHTPPSWYATTTGFDNFNMVAFADSMNNFSNSTSSNMTSAPSNSGGSGFGGGGFSGGGFGGGGGSGL